MPTGVDAPACSASPATTPDSATTEPHDRSMPPVMITKVCPQATTAISDVATRIARMLAVVRNCGVVTARNSTISTNTAKMVTSPDRLDRFGRNERAGRMAAAAC